MVELSYFGSVSLLDVFLLLRSVISVSLENTEVEIELQKNGYMPKKKKKKWVCGITFLTAPSFLCQDL